MKQQTERTDMTLKELIDKATPRPWETRDTMGQITTSRGVGIASVLCGLRGERGFADMQLIAHAVNVLPLVVEALEDAREFIMDNAGENEKFIAASEAISDMLDEANNVNTEGK